MKQPKIGIIGRGGAVGVELEEKFKNHPVFKDCLTEMPENLSKKRGLEWEELIQEILESNDLVVLAVHDEIAKKIIEVKKKIKSSTKIIDCSTAHRNNPKFTYGLPELDGREEEIKNTELVSNPGCHATASILSAKPLTEKKLIKNFGVITSITGFSGGGKAMIETYEEKNMAPLQYSTGKKHKHVEEIQNQGGLENIIFQPEVVNTFRGLKTNSFFELTEIGKKMSEAEILEIYKNYYKNQTFIKVSQSPEDGKISMDENNKTQNVSIYITKHKTQIQVTAVLDNLGKGAAGAAIQNANIMLGLDGSTGFITKIPKS